MYIAIIRFIDHIVHATFLLLESEVANFINTSKQIFEECTIKVILLNIFKFRENYKIRLKFYLNFKSRQKKKRDGICTFLFTPGKPTTAPLRDNPKIPSSPPPSLL